MREVLCLRAGGYESLNKMGLQFQIVDRDNSGQVSKQELDTALDILFSAYNVKFSISEKNALFSYFDLDRSQTVDYSEFVRAIRGNMNSFRRNLVKQAFAQLDKTGCGEVTLQDMTSIYDVSTHPAVQSGRVSAEDAMRSFMSYFDGNNDGRIGLDEFYESYQWISASIDSDDYFELMLRNAWHLSGGEETRANTANLRVLVKHSSSPDEVVELAHDMGLPQDLAERNREVVRRLQQTGMEDIVKVELFA